MSILIVFSLLLVHMAKIVSAAPLPELCADMCALVGGAQFQTLVRRSRSLTEKILIAIPDAHKTSVYAEMLKLDSSENAQLGTMASMINFPAVPELNWERASLESSLIHTYERLQLDQALLNAVLTRLENTHGVADLTNNVRDLSFQISKMLRALPTDYVVQMTPSPVNLLLSGDFEVQVATHLTLLQLRSLGQDIRHFLRNLDSEPDSHLLA
ncbi:uncharacterized protein LOC130909833 [Corythoichthys intestinalis]|uniref:uncharacterized protein LOC130909833 n=1 Tax=Corythoichthys intestinalis TaxID=161448 RepID=UPI0025A55BE3|nr:uncharacterized protein LOC130909833 [Corythoichthys intestinalis]